jgi:hypothetical protein
MHLRSLNVRNSNYGFKTYDFEVSLLALRTEYNKNLLNGSKDIRGTHRRTDRQKIVIV